jgi:hypothetical protein
MQKYSYWKKKTRQSRSAEHTILVGLTLVSHAAVP